MNAPLIPQANPGAAFRSRRDALLKAAADVLDGGWYINGKQVRQFEESFAAFCSVKHAVGVGNGTDAIEVALRALGIGKGGLVFTVSHTAVATVAAIECAGATPVLVDVDPVTYTMSPESLAKALEAARAGRYPGKPAAVLPVHLYGCCADLDAIRAVAGDLPLIEDCAQAHGAAYKGRPAGSTGIAGTFSFYPTKNLGAVGDGGCVVTSDDALAERIRSVREYGWRTHYLSSEPGINTRLDELQAAFLNVLLPELPAKNAKRRALAELYRRELSGVPALSCRRFRMPWNRFTISMSSNARIATRCKGGSATGAWALPSTTPSRCTFRMPTGAAWRSRRTACPLPRRSCRASSACPCIPNSPRPTPLPSPEASAMSFPL